MNRYFPSLFAAALLVVSHLSYANHHIDLMVGGFEAACPEPVNPVCAVQYWHGAYNQIAQVVQYYQSQVNNPGFGHWCAANRLECDEFYAEAMAASEAGVYASDQWNYWASQL